MNPTETHLDSADRENQIRETLVRKPAMKSWYEDQYAKYREVLSRSPVGGIALELGSGAGFAKECVPELTTSDLIPYAGVDRSVDATQMAFPDHSLRAVFLMNVLHHIPDTPAFFKELVRTLQPGGRCLIIDQNRGIPSRWILKYAHHEPYQADADEWAFPSTGPLSGANGALAWIIFYRDRKRFEKLYPGLSIRRLQPHTPLLYWLAGGLKAWSLVPAPLLPLAKWMDQILVTWFPILGSFVDIELERVMDPSEAARRP